mgnify:CR=1 FL=1
MAVLSRCENIRSAEAGVVDERSLEDRLCFAQRLARGLDRFIESANASQIFPRGKKLLRPITNSVPLIENCQKSPDHLGQQLFVAVVNPEGFRALKTDEILSF